MNEEEFINDFYKGNDYRKFAILQEIYRENFDLKNKLNEIKEIINNCSDNLDDIMCYDIDKYKKLDILEIIEKVNKEE